MFIYMYRYTHTVHIFHLYSNSNLHTNPDIDKDNFHHYLLRLFTVFLFLRSYPTYVQICHGQNINSWRQGPWMWMCWIHGDFENHQKVVVLKDFVWRDTRYFSLLFSEQHLTWNGQQEWNSLSQIVWRLLIIQRGGSLTYIWPNLQL